MASNPVDKPRLSKQKQAEKSQREFNANMLASFSTGVTIISFTNPVDTLKCRWQVADRIVGQTFRGFSGQVMAQEGLWRGLWAPGLGPNQLAMGCAIGGRNGFYPLIRDGLATLTGTEGKIGPGGMFAAGLFSGMAGYMVASPLLQIKTQMQAEAGRVGPTGLLETGAKAGAAPSYKGGIDGLRQVAASGGVRGLWRGCGVIVGRGAVLSASQLMTYDGIKTSLKEQQILNDGPVLHVSASLSAAVVCTTLTMPLDVVLTVYQSAQTLGGERLRRYGTQGPVNCAINLVKDEGPAVLMRGWTPAFIRLAPTCVASFWLYEQLRKLVGIGFLD